MDLFLLFFLQAIFAVEITFQSVLIDAPVGNIEGKILTDPKNNTYYGFLAIPYALPPVGDLRFAKPVPHPKFESTFSAKDAIISCPQYGPFAFIEPNGQEDCLTLNVYTKQLHPRAKRKVLVFIHGGGFIMGSAKAVIPGTFVKDQDVIVVSIQYRLGILGFFSTDDESAPGNFGLWDQVLALKWVKNNIAAFGGDPDDITISGESAGAAAVSLLSLSPAAKGLFTKVYSHSGSSSSIFAYAPTPHNDMLRFAKQTSCWDGDVDQRIHTSQSSEVVKCLRKLPLSDIVAYVDPTLTTPKFVPVIDGEFLAKSPIKLLNDNEYLKSIEFYDHAYLVAINNNEAGFMSSMLSMTEAAAQQFGRVSKGKKETVLTNLWNDYWHYYTLYRWPQANESSVHRVKDWYSKRYNSRDALVQLVTDLSFLIPAYDFVDAASKGDNSKVWLLNFDYHPKFMKGRFRGTFHAVDLVYWLDIPLSHLERVLHAGMKGRMDEEDKHLKQSFSTLIADFMKTGDPGSSLKSSMEEIWPEYDCHRGSYLSFRTKPSVEQHLDQDKKLFWLR